MDEFLKEETEEVIHNDMWSFLASLEPEKKEEPKAVEPETPEQILTEQVIPEQEQISQQQEPQEQIPQQQDPQEQIPRQQETARDMSAGPAVTIRKRKVQLHHGIILLAAVACVIFGIGDAISYKFGMYGTLFDELLLLALALIMVRWAGADWKPIFQFRKIKGSQLGGTIILWIGTFLVAILFSGIITMIFPEQSAQVSSGLSSSFTSISFIPAVLIVALSPAVCEEAVFRGVFFNSVWNKSHKKWLTILVTAFVFGAFHGSIVRFFPTFILGIALGFLVFETNNFIYNMLFHFINNLVPLVLLFGISSFSYLDYADEYTDVVDYGWETMLSSLGIYLMLAALGVFLIYLGVYLIRKGRPGYDKGIFPPDRHKESMILFIVVGCMLALGFVVLIYGLILDVLRLFAGY